MKSNSTKDNSFFSVFIAISALTVSLAFYGVTDWGLKLDSGEVSSNVLGASTVSYTASIRINDTINTKIYNGITFEKGDTAYNLLLNAEDQSSFEFEGDLYDFGYYVHTINGRRSLNNEYWKFVLNGEDSTVHMEEYEVKNGDIIEFDLEKL